MNIRIVLNLSLVNFAPHLCGAPKNIANESNKLLFLMKGLSVKKCLRQIIFKAI